MTRAAAFLAFLITFQAAGQTLDTGKADSSLQRTDHRHKTVLDSISAIVSINRYRDSLRINTWSDSLRTRVNQKFSPLKLAGIADSLRRFGHPEVRITHRVDSLLGAKDALLKEVNLKQEALQQTVWSRYSRWSESIRKRFNLDSAGAKLPAMAVPGNPVTLPGSPLPAGTQMPAAGIDLPEIPGLQTGDFAGLELSHELNAAGGDLSIPGAQRLTALDGLLPDIPDPMKEINGQVAGVKSLTRDPGELAEKSVMQVSEVSKATKELQEAEQLKKQSEELKAAEQLKDPNEARETLKEQAVNHFVGKEAEIQGAMSQMSKYKKKYSSIGSLSEIRKNDWMPHNGLKGKPFKERFRVGMNVGYKGSGDTLIFDFYPNASYRITGRLEAGLGAIYRLRVNSEPLGFDQRNPVWGTSAFVLLKTFKAVHLRCEVDGNSFPVSGSADRTSYRDWRWSFHAGIQTNFKLGKRWTGNVQMLYNFDSSLKDGFPEKLSARVGVLYGWK
jgi:hypothetical protein